MLLLDERFLEAVKTASETVQEMTKFRPTQRKPAALRCSPLPPPSAAFLALLPSFPVLPLLAFLLLVFPAEGFLSNKVKQGGAMGWTAGNTPTSSALRLSSAALSSSSVGW